MTYDTLRSADASDFVDGAECVESDDGPNREATDLDDPAPGAVFHYLIRAQNSCPDGNGPSADPPPAATARPASAPESHTASLENVPS